MSKRYQKITQDAEGILHGEYAEGHGRDWTKFSARPDLLKIRTAMDEGGAALHAQIWALTDAYGEQGMIPPQGYDWSGVRDSSEQAIKAMEEIADKWMSREQRRNGTEWPWLRSLRLGQRVARARNLDAEREA